MRRSAAALSLAVLALVAGCRSSYDGPSFAGDWVASSAGVTTLTLTLTQDLGAWLDAPVRGDLLDAGGRSWTFKGEPAREGEQGLLRGRPLRVGLGDPLRLVTDEGEPRAFEAGPLPWLLVRGRLPSGEDAITVHVGQGGPLWADVDGASWVHCTFRRRSDAPASLEPAAPDEPAARACKACGRGLEDDWRHCPGCGALVE